MGAPWNRRKPVSAGYAHFEKGLALLSLVRPLSAQLVLWALTTTTTATALLLLVEPEQVQVMSSFVELLMSSLPWSAQPMSSLLDCFEM